MLGQLSAPYVNSRETSPWRIERSVSICSLAFGPGHATVLSRKAAQAAVPFHAGICLKFQHFMLSGSACWERTWDQGLLLCCREIVPRAFSWQFGSEPRLSFTCTMGLSQSEQEAAPARVESFLSAVLSHTSAAL